MVLLYLPLTAIPSFQKPAQISCSNYYPMDCILANCLQSGDCALSMTDSSTAEGWMRKTNFRVSDKDQIQMDVRVKAAQKFA
jgi:hypothetical protein